MCKEIHWTAGLILAGLWLGLPAGTAAAEQLKAYGWLDAGGTVVQDTDLKSFLDQPVSGSKVKFDPGFRFGCGVGCEFNRYLAAELETGFSWNGVKAITGADHAEASLYQVPLLANLIVQLPIELRNRSRLVPVFGAGVGGAGVSLDMHEISVGGYYAYGTAYDFVFAYQGLAGLRYEFNKKMSVGVYYRYFAADSPSFEPDYYYYASGDIRLGTLQTHSLSLRFDWRF